MIGVGVGVGMTGRSRKTYLKDGYNRADNATGVGNAETGQAYTPDSSTVFGISNGRLYRVSGTGTRIVATAVADNYSLQATCSTMTSGSAVQRLVFRYTDSLNEMLFGKLDASNFHLVRRVGGVATTLASIAQVPVNGDVLRVEVRGALIIAKINGIVVATVTDSANNTASKVGLWLGDNTCRFDDLLVEAL